MDTVSNDESQGGDDSEEQMHETLRKGHFKDEEEEKANLYQESQKYHDHELQLLEEGNIHEMMGILETPQNKRRQRDVIMEENQTNSARTQTLSQKKRINSALRGNDEEGEDLVESTNRLMTVRVEELQSKMRSKRDMHHVLHSRRKLSFF